jgi:hypothetical protein
VSPLPPVDAWKFVCILRKIFHCADLRSDSAITTRNFSFAGDAGIDLSLATIPVYNRLGKDYIITFIKQL